MTPAAILILGIIDKSLALALEIQRGMPEESKRAFWERHDKAMAFWQDLFERMSGQIEEDTNGEKGKDGRGEKA